MTGPLTVNGTISGVTEPTAENSVKMASTAWVKTQGYQTAAQVDATRAVNFTATGASYGNTPGVDNIVSFPTVTVGNSGNWWATSRFTPPAGRYVISTAVGTQAPSTGNGTWTLKIKKNGSAVDAGLPASGATLFSIPISLTVVVEANGIDYFEVTANPQTAGMNVQGGHLSAWPV
jgi:hypothetical protein